MLNADLMPNARMGLNSAKMAQTTGKKGVSHAASEFTLPPILKPLLND